MDTNSTENPTFSYLLQDFENCKSKFTGLTNNVKSQEELNPFIAHINGFIALKILNLTNIYKNQHTITLEDISEKSFLFGKKILTTKKQLPKSKNLEVLDNLFKNELKTYDYNKIGYTKAYLIEVFESIASPISTLKFNHANLFINNSKKIKFSLYFENNISLMINKSLELKNELNNDNLVIYSFFSNKELILSDIIEIGTLVDGFEKYLEAQI
ncbi:hypothetical protein [Flavobacterium rhizosphaerae]|uniref:RiboL-PSP-HEPN domain-containing protein n=1 Tax=Flavobacterium rhizosphaerae TaxID=3163298 RepID=A0ABW8Z0W8_9FLAO